MRIIVPQKFNFQSVEGISKNQLTQHYQLYKGYVEKINLIWRKLKEEKFTKPNTTYSPYRCLKLGESYALNGVKLHELYFGNLGGDKNKAYGNLLEKIKKDFESFENWRQDFLDAGKSSRGWVVVAFDLIDGQIRNYLCDAHDQGGIWNSLPILVLDVYEHAYMIDFGIDRNKYLNVFMQNIDWEVCEDRYNKILRHLQKTPPIPYPIPIPYWIK
ncbi:superoxide dismutase [Marinisporobacter balticus]|uniref:superoxide dismutase n=1 Tax=Marinisporobacter balticus TaxID=2018667 RepID=A0A4R2KMP9_9FIRM|nr:Fe-Mn family superoxide dismutase [Marinisporobacter balticus]TCO73827.1 Fe-Mn family superoxide dismutase [Marinisporobacter balticus]